jgi:hypothetical protein
MQLAIGKAQLFFARNAAAVGNDGFVFRWKCLAGAGGR